MKDKRNLEHQQEKSKSYITKLESALVKKEPGAQGPIETLRDQCDDMELQLKASEQINQELKESMREAKEDLRVMSRALYLKA